MQAMSTGPAEFKAFLTKWRSAITYQSDLWEGPRAVGELRRAAGYWGLILCKPDLAVPSRWMLHGVFDEVEDYRAQKEVWQHEFRDTEICLAKIGRTAERQSNKTATVHLKNILHTVALGIEEQRIAVRSYLDRGEKGSPLGAMWEQFWPNRARIEIIERGIDLDTRLQFQCAKMLRIFLRTVSLRTIARLIVLVYWTTGLATVKNDGLWIVNERRQITVRSVEEKLIRNRFPKKTREVPLDEIPWVREAR
jgi:hypothetical protein